MTKVKAVILVRDIDYNTGRIQKRVLEILRKNRNVGEFQVAVKTLRKAVNSRQLLDSLKRLERRHILICLPTCYLELKYPKDPGPRRIPNCWDDLVRYYKERK